MDQPSFSTLELRPHCSALGWVVLPSGIVVGFDAGTVIAPPGVSVPDTTERGCEYLFGRLLSATDYAAAYRYAREMAHPLGAASGAAEMAEVIE